MSDVSSKPGGPEDGVEEVLADGDLRRAREMAPFDAVERISHALFQTLDLDELVETTLRIALEEVDAEAGSILLADAQRAHLVFQYSIGASPVARGTSIPWDKGISGAVFQSGEGRITEHVHANNAHLKTVDSSTGFVTRDMITVPLRRWRGAPIGVLNLLNKRGGPPTQRDLGLLTVVSAFAALAIQQARHFEDAKKAELVALLGDIGHDLKNLLTPVTAGLEIMHTEVQELFGAMSAAELEKNALARETCDEAVDIMRQGIRRLHERVKDLADCVKGMSSPPHFAPCAVGDVVLEVFKTLEVLARGRDVSLRMTGLDTLPSCRADERRLYSAFYNLVNNAIAETQAGGSISVTGSLDADGSGVALAVTDTGRGMRAEVRERLFSAQALSTKRGGTGLGTKIVKDVVDAHRGRIWVESEEGVGTTFHIRLPMDPTAPRAP